MAKEKKKDNKESRYAYKKKSAWEILSKEQIKKAFTFSENYKKFLNEAKTERESINFIQNAAKKAKKKNFVNKDKEAAIVIPGKKPISDGLRILFHI